MLRRPRLEYTLSRAELDQKRALKRSLTWFDIAILGISMSVGAGIFSVGAKVISEQAGPAAIISFLIAAVVCALAAMCYAEFASSIPIAGSAYTFSYSTLGEIIAWVIGWNIILELFMAGSVVIKYWAVYLYTSMRLLGVSLPGQIHILNFNVDWTIFLGAIFFTSLLVFGTKLSARVASVFVVIKIGVILFVVIAGFRYFDPQNLVPFIPDATPISGESSLETQSILSALLGLTPQAFGVMGIFSGAAIIFFAFIGFDNAAAVAEETLNPRRNMPIGLMVGIGVVSLLYMLTAVVSAGMVPISGYLQYKAEHPDETVSLATAFEINGQNFAGAISAMGAFVGLTTVVLICMLGLSRVLFAISRDGLLPRYLSETSKRGTPARLQIMIGVAIAVTAAFADVDTLAEMINVGTLSAFVVVSFSVPILRKRMQEFDSAKEQRFRVPLSPGLPIISGTICILLSLNLAVITWVFFLIWVAAGLVIYFGYGVRHSELAKHPENIQMEMV
ncbi:MAG: amino acid permease [Candidatus Ancillula sp.]|nr:amino acid permease [Candidatus Ancillula sp.]